MKSKTMRFQQTLYQSDQAVCAIEYFEHQAEHELNISIPVTNHLYALAINLNSSSDTYWIGNRQHNIQAGYFNILSIRQNSTNWLFKEGENSVLLIKCTPPFMSMMAENFIWLTTAAGTTEVVGPLLPCAHVITPSMEADVERVLSDKHDTGPLRTMYMHAKGSDLWFSALQTYDDQWRGKVDDDSILKIKSVHEYMELNVATIYDAGELVAMADMPLERFNRIFELLYHMTPEQAVQRERLHVAESLVCYSREDIFDISLKAGFLSFQSFLDAFEGQFGMHPLKFRATYGQRRLLD